jgi:MerR family mercuric resistance operon transcriptional regulator
MTAYDIDMHTSSIQDKNELTIGRLAKAACVSIETIRYYQRVQLLPTPAPERNAFRHYPVEMIERIRFIKRAQELGFSLDEIGTLLRLNDGTDRNQVRELAQVRLSHIRAKINDLRRMETILAKLVQECAHTDHTHSCPIIAAFSSQPSVSPAPHGVHA